MELGSLFALFYPENSLYNLFTGIACYLFGDRLELILIETTGGLALP